MFRHFSTQCSGTRAKLLQNIACKYKENHPTFLYKVAKNKAFTPAFFNISRQKTYKDIKTKSEKFTSRAAEAFSETAAAKQTKNAKCGGA